MIFLFSNLNKTIENYKYQISTLRNCKFISEKDKKILKHNENLIYFSKITCRALILVELAILLRKYKKKGFSREAILLMIIRLNMNWFITLYITKTNLKKSIEKLNARLNINQSNSNIYTSEFSNYIIHK